MKNRVVVIGAGGHGRSVAEIVIAMGEHELVGFFDDRAERAQRVWDRPVLGPTGSLADYRHEIDAAVVAIGNNKLRERFHAELRAAGVELLTVVHPRSIISASASIGAGSAIMAGAIVGTEAVLGEGVIVNSGAVVDHHCTVGDFGHLGTNACMAGGSSLGACAWIQAGSALGYSVHVEPGAVLKPSEGRVGH